MKVKTAEEFNVFELFVHDNEAVHAICPYELTEAINEHLENWTVCPPESLHRFTLFSRHDDEDRYIERYYNIQQVKGALPEDAVDQLEAINEMDLDLSPKQMPD